MATDQAASLREAFRDLMIALTGTPLVGDGSLWWAILYALGIGGGGFPAVDRHAFQPACRPAFWSARRWRTALAVAGRLGWILPHSGTGQVMWLAGAEMPGNLMLLAAMTFYARHVILDAEGLLPRREPQPDDELAEEEAAADVESPSSASDRWTKIDPPHATPQPAFQRAASPATSSVPSPGPTPFASPVNRKLTKAERKALKERLLRERLERQREGM